MGFGDPCLWTLFEACPYQAWFYSGCQKNAPLFERFFATTTYTSLPYFGTYF